MTTKESKKLKAGDRVVFSDGVAGTVNQTGYVGVQINWEDGQCGVIHHDDMECVSREPVAA
jgi:preprotein translocase subunit YajC